MTQEFQFQINDYVSYASDDERFHKGSKGRMGRIYTQSYDIKRKTTIYFVWFVPVPGKYVKVGGWVEEKKLIGIGDPDFQDKIKDRMK